MYICLHFYIAFGTRSEFFPTARWIETYAGHITNAVTSPFDTADQGSPTKEPSLDMSSHAVELFASALTDEQLADVGLEDQPQAYSPTAKYPLTLENVEMVLNELRPYLMADGGNVRVVDIEGSVVRVELEGACGDCISSATTMQMGIERKLKEAIPEISHVLQDAPDSLELTNDAIEEVLETIRPFLSVAGGTIALEKISDASTIQPKIQLKIEGKTSHLASVRQEIASRVRRHFVIPGLQVLFITGDGKLASA